jgi:protein required for attachment to host cells
MQIPEHLRHFPEATLIVLTDEQEAKFLLAGGDSLEHLDSLSLPRERMSDNEGMTETPGGYISGHDLSDAHDTPRKKKFAAMVAERITQFVQNGQTEDVHLVSPKEMMNMIEKKLPNDVDEHIRSRLPKDLMKLSDVELLERIFEKPE